MAQIYHEPRFKYSGYMATTNVCDVRIFDNPGGPQVALVTELIKRNGEYATDGTSVTNVIERIASSIRVDLGFVFSALIEFYPERGPNAPDSGHRWHDPMFGETFALVIFDKFDGLEFHGVEWDFITRAEAEALCGEPLPQIYAD